MKKPLKMFGAVSLSIMLAVLAACSSETSKTGSESSKDSEFPQKSITLIVPSTAGGGTDTTARALAAEAEEYLGQPIGVVNKPGGSGSIGMTEGANAKADGYTVTMAFVELTMYEHLGLSPLTPDQIKPVGLINFDPSALTVAADAPYDTLDEFIAYAKENPGKVKIGNSGTGSIWHIAAASLESNADIKVNHVPFEGAAQATTALVGGHVDAVTVSPAEVKAQLDAGKVKTLAVMSGKRSDIIPDVPTFKEAGLDVEQIGTWRGLTVPKDTPDEVVTVLEDAFLKAAEKESFTKFMSNSGLGIQLKSASEFKTYMKENYDLYGKVISGLDLN
ncbi:tripartite tricarboxylate transporter substrate binding protein [Metabacillus herbersteinensis]|uniref:Tripartite tricarboxylate transporter substrate binding protein n=1 Tax=Metabacillus herbersteinensis TaxID=283816 RepID=A0ABV6GKF7_9BACI